MASGVTRYGIRTAFIRNNDMTKKLTAQIDNRAFVIEPDLPDVGVYLRIYEVGRDIADYLQDSVQHCIEFAQEDFDVPIDAWQPMEL